MSTALITGAARGIGRATAIRFARDGYDVAVNHHESSDEAAAVAENVREYGSDAVVVEADTTDESDAERLVEEAADALGGLDHLVNNGGEEAAIHGERLDVEAITPGNLNGEAFETGVEGVLTAAYRVTEAAATELSRSVDLPSVTHVAAVPAVSGTGSNPHYATLAGAVSSLTESHAREFAPDIRVNAVAPSHVDAGVEAGRSADEKRDALESIPLGHFGQPEDAADAAAYLRDAGFVTGETIHVNGGAPVR